MKIDRRRGLIAPARQCPSPNQDARPCDAALELIVVHAISLPPGCFGGDAIDALFTNRLNAADDPCFETLLSLRVSAHLLIRRDGEVIQYVPLHRRAWHAGVSFYRHRSCCNDFSVGIELEGCDDVSYEKIQYHRLAEVIRCLRESYPQLVDIVGHCDIAPERKTDPGPAFDWNYLGELLRAPSLIRNGVVR